MRLFGSIVCLASLVLSSLPTMAQTDASKPNILLIIADDMGLDASRCYSVGKNQAKMPVIETLCDQGMVFENAYAAPTCSPTRATILTGRYGFRTGVGSAITPAGGNGLSSDETSLFDVLNGQGYASIVVGKWHVSVADDGLNHPAELGVTEYYGTYQGAVRDYFQWEGVHNGQTFRADGYTTTMFTQRAIDWVAAQESPWFLWLAYNAPHAPFHLPPAELHTATELTDDPAAIRRNPIPYYNAMLEAMDTEIGRLLDSMPADVRNNTVVMFIGDNGTPGQVARGIYGDRGAKGSIFEGGTHVPLVVQGPNVGVGRSEALINSADLFATISGLSGAQSNADDAIDFLHALDDSIGARRYAYVEHFSDLPPSGPDTYGWAIRNARYKLVAVSGEPQMLFDLESDPLERVNLLSNSISDAAKAATIELQKAYDALGGKTGE